MANTVQSGSALDTATWGGALPTGGEIAYVYHAITGPTGQLDCSLSFQSGGSLTVTGAFAITGGVANEQREPTPLVVPAGASFSCDGGALGMDGSEAGPGVALIGFIGLLLHIGGSIAGGNGQRGGDGEGATSEGAGDDGSAGAAGAAAIEAAGAGRIEIGGTCRGGGGGTGGGGGAGYADEYCGNGGGNGGGGGDGAPAIVLSDWTGEIEVTGDCLAGDSGAGGNGGDGAHWDDGMGGGNDGDGGSGGGGGAGAPAITGACHAVIDGDCTGGPAGPSGSPGGAEPAGVGGDGANGAAGVDVTTAEIGGDVTRGADAGEYTGGYGASFSDDGSVIYGACDGVDASDLRVLFHGEVKGANNRAVFVLPDAIAADEIAYFHAEFSDISLDLQGVACDCEGAVVIVKVDNMSILQDVTTEIVLLSADAHAVAIGVEIPITPFSTEIPNYPAESDVRDGIEFGEAYIGTVELPAESDVQGGVSYGAGGAEYTGTLAGFTSADRAELDALYAKVGRLDSLPTSGLVATQADVQGITQAQRVRVVPPPLLERPDSDSIAYRVWIYCYNELHQAEDLDDVPVVTVENNAGVDRSAGLGSVTKPGGTTGVYYVDYTVASSHAIEGLAWKVAATEGGVTTHYVAASLVVDTTAVDFTSADRAALEAVAAVAAKADTTYEANGENYRLTAAALGNVPATLTQQDVADAQLLAPSGEAAEGSVIDRLDQIDTNALDQQDVADALLLAPDGEAEDGSVMDTLDAIASASIDQQAIANSLLLAPVGEASEGSAMDALADLQGREYGPVLAALVLERGASAAVRLEMVDPATREPVAYMPTGGTFALTFNGESTASLDWGANAAQVQAALAALPSIGEGNVYVEGRGLNAYIARFQVVAVLPSIAHDLEGGQSITFYWSDDTGGGPCYQVIDWSAVAEGYSFTLTYGEDTTSTLSRTVEPSAVVDALNMLDSILQVGGVWLETPGPTSAVIRFDRPGPRLLITGTNGAVASFDVQGSGFCYEWELSWGSAVPTVTLARDGAAAVAATNGPAEAAAGEWWLTLTAAELTCSVAVLRATLEGAEDFVLHIATRAAINQQDVADAALLAPAGEAAEGSVQSYLVALAAFGAQVLAMVEEDGEGGYRYTAEALAEAPAVEIAQQAIAEAMTLAPEGEAEANSVLARLIALKGKADTLAAGTHVQTVPVSGDGKTITLTRGDSYTLARGRELTWQDKSGTWPDLSEATGATFTLAARSGGATIVTKAATIDLEGAQQAIYVELTAEETTLFPVGANVGKWDIEVRWADGSRWTLPATGNGKATVYEDVTR